MRTVVSMIVIVLVFALLLSIFFSVVTISCVLTVVVARVEAFCFFIPAVLFTGNKSECGGEDGG